MGKVKEKITENKTKGRALKLLCSDCNRSTKHIVLASIDEDGSEEWDEDCWISWENNYQIVQCQGCETISFRHLNWFSEYQDHDSSGHTERVYPKRDLDTLKIKELLNVPKVLRRIYRETIEAFNSECLTLCAAGLRGIVEGICANQGVADGPVEVPAKGGGTKTVRKDNLEGKISGLYEKGILTQGSADILHGHRFLGNEAVHELAQPSSDELQLAIEIIEHTLEQLYEIPEKAFELKQKMLCRKGKS